jgi:hypothetical protein
MRGEMALLQQTAKFKIDSVADAILVEKGFKGMLSLKFMWLKLLKLSVIFAKPLLIGIILLALFCAVALYGGINLIYLLYFFKAFVALLFNTLMTIGNALWFAFYALTQMMALFFTSLINAVVAFFLTPVVGSINAIIAAIEGTINRLILTINTGLNTNFNLASFGRAILPEFGPTEFFARPDKAIAYWYPDPIEMKLTGGIAWGTVIGFTPFMPGQPVYAVDETGSTIYDPYGYKDGAGINYPRMNHDSIADGFWTDIDRPPPSIIDISDWVMSLPYLIYGDRYDVGRELVGRTITARMRLIQLMEAAMAGSTGVGGRINIYPYRQDPSGYYQVKTEIYNRDYDEYEHIPYFFVPYDAIQRMINGGHDAYIGFNRLVNSYYIKYNLFYFRGWGEPLNDFLTRLAGRDRVNIINFEPVHPGEAVPNCERYRSMFKIGEFALEGDTHSRYYPIHYNGREFVMTDDGGMALIESVK